MILQVDIMKMQRKAIKKGFQNVSEISWSRKKSNNMVGNDKKILLKMKNNGWLSIEKDLKREKIQALHNKRLVLKVLGWCFLFSLVVGKVSFFAFFINKILSGINKEKKI